MFQTQKLGQVQRALHGAGLGVLALAVAVLLWPASGFADNPSTRPSGGQGDQIANRLKLVPKGWVSIAYDFNHDGKYDAVEDIYAFDLERARTRSQACHHGSEQGVEGEQAANEWSSEEQSDRVPGQGRADQEQMSSNHGQTLRVRGEILSTRPTAFTGQDQEHLLARIRLHNGRVEMADLGPVADLGEVRPWPGDRVSLVARQGRINGQPALLAEQLRTRGQLVQIDVSAQNENQSRIHGTPVSPQEQGAEESEWDMERREQNVNAEERQGFGTQTREFVACRLSSLAPANVRNNKGTDLGHICGIAVDTTDGRVAYAVLAYGGFLGIGSKDFAVPWSALKKNVGRNERSSVSYVLNIDKNKLENANGLEDDQWPGVADQFWSRQSQQLFGQRPYWATRRASIQGTPISPGQRNSGRTARALFVDSDNLIGHDLLDETGNKFAELSDVMVDPQSGALAYAIIQPDQGSDLPADAMFAVPWERIRIQPTNAGARGKALTDDSAFKVVLNISRDQLRGGPRFPERNWPNMTTQWGERVYNYYGVQPFWEHGGEEQ